MKQRGAKGFTIVELLVAAVIFGIVLAGVGSFLIGGLRFSGAATIAADQLREVNDASGYLSDMVRRSARLGSSTGSDCGGDATAVSCISLVVPAADTAARSVEWYHGVQFHLIERGTVPAAQRSDDAWADDNTWAIVEYRKLNLVTCTVPAAPNPVPPCPAPAVTATATVTDGSWAGPYLVLDHVSDLSTFEVVGDSVRLAIQVATSRRGTITATPTAPQEIVVSLRNVD